MPNAAPGFVSRTEDRVDLLPESLRVKVAFAGIIIADSKAALRVEETGHNPVCYLREKDVRLDLMHPTEHHTRCRYEGEASYWTIKVSSASGSIRPSENAVWGHPTPYDEVAALASHYAFYSNRVESITVT